MSDTWQAARRLDQGGDANGDPIDPNRWYDVDGFPIKFVDSGSKAP